MKRSASIALAVAAAGLLYLPASHATLIGDNIDLVLGFNPPNLNPVFINQNVVVTDPGVEGDTGLFSVNRQMLVDVSGSRVEITEDDTNTTCTSCFSATWQVQLDDLDWVNQLGSIIDVIPDAQNPVGIDFANFGPSDIVIQGGGYSVSTGNFYTWGFDIVTTHVPEPTTLALTGIGLAGLGFSGRKQLFRGILASRAGFDRFSS
jgi:hypothetical protein